MRIGGIERARPIDAADGDIFDVIWLPISSRSQRKRDERERGAWTSVSMSFSL